jgi:predicted nucleotidyltransferase
MIQTGDIPSLMETASLALQGMPHVAAAYLFGSAARGREAGDLDIGILLAGPDASGDDLEAEARLAAALRERMPGVRVDVRVLNRQSLAFRHNVLKTGRLLADNRRRERIDFEVRTTLAFHDLKPYLDRYDRCLHANLLRGYHGYRPGERQQPA